METWDRFGEDWAELPPDVKTAVASFLERLQRNPYDPDIQKKAVIGENERFAYEFSQGYALYWRVDCKSLSISKMDDIEITLLGLQCDPARR